MEIVGRLLTDEERRNVLRDPHIVPKGEGAGFCVGGKLDLHALSRHVEEGFEKMEKEGVLRDIMR